MDFPSLYTCNIEDDLPSYETFRVIPSEDINYKEDDLPYIIDLQSDLPSLNTYNLQNNLPLQKHNSLPPSNHSPKTANSFHNSFIFRYA